MYYTCFPPSPWCKLQWRRGGEGRRNNNESGVGEENPGSEKKLTSSSLALSPNERKSRGEEGLKPIMLQYPHKPLQEKKLLFLQYCPDQKGPYFPKKVRTPKGPPQLRGKGPDYFQKGSDHPEVGIHNFAQKV